MHNTYTDNTRITDKRYRQNSNTKENTKENTRLVPAFVGAGPCTRVVPCIWVIPSAVCAPNATHTQTHTQTHTDTH